MGSAERTRYTENTGNTENAIFANSIQPAETNEYMNYAELMVKEGILDIFDVDIVYAGRLKISLQILNNFPKKKFDKLS